MATSPHSSRSWGTVVTIAVVATVLRGLGCEPAGNPGDDGSEATAGFDASVQLEAVATQLVLPAYNDFLESARALESATGTWESAPETDRAEAKDAARDAWREAMLDWQRAELFQIGPAGSSITVVGGEDLRDEIYSWPTVNPCRLDQELVESVWDESGFFSNELVNVYGLDAIEYLLFREDSENTCPPQIPINSDGSWDALGDDGLESKRAAYASAASTHVVAVAEQLIAAWDPTQGDFSGQLAGAGEDGSVYLDTSQGMNAIFNALFYVELIVKDRKLARPLGLRDCSTETCPEALETPWADYSLESLRANLVAGRDLLIYGEGDQRFGLNVLAEHLGEDELAAEMLSTLDATIAAVDAISDTGLTTLESEPQTLHSLYETLKSFTDLLKGEFAMALFLEVPQEAAGDSD